MEPLPPQWRLVEFGAGAPAPVDDLVPLHLGLLPESPIAALGARFARVYYGKYSRLGLIQGVVAYDDVVPVGLIVATHRPNDFMRVGLARSWPALVGALGLTLMASPGRLSAVLETIRIMRSVSQIDDTTPAGEILSLAVQPIASNKAANRSEISRRLVSLMVRRLQDRGLQAVRAIVDRDNLAARMFYAGCGWRQRAEAVGGWRKPTVEMALDL